MRFFINKMKGKTYLGIKQPISHFEIISLRIGTGDDPEQHPGHLEDIVQVYKGDSKGRENITQGAAQIDADASGEVNIKMEASISSDDISSFLPVASDSTDFEASLRDARDYEDPQEEICKPGLGWTEAAT
ncbi:hypothetical protein F0562_015581 [Nyssa sinensis]|uniref:Uncharacterized protein n=1 Tax=Nyssa sinensis TaxID=561372 RepID=A0A5J4ZLG5_9ASTE|nr:hypothetical protein F0562_015581 [Nyssa sinensis]